MCSCSFSQLVQLFFRLLKNLKNEPKYVLEIGGGYGGMAHKIKKKFSNTKIFSFDIPQSNLITHYYLKTLHPDLKIFDYNEYVNNGLKVNLKDFENYDFFILPTPLLDQLPHNRIFDLTINTRSFQEMNKKTINFIFSSFQKRMNQNSIFYNVNGYQKKIGNENIRILDFDYDDKWEILKKDIINNLPGMYELILKRLDKSNNNFHNQLKQIEPIKITKITRKNSFTRFFLNILFNNKILKKIIKKIFKIYV